MRLQCYKGKLTNLVEILKDMQSAVLAYSGGVDSTLLLKALQVSCIRTLAITAVSDITPHNDLLMAKKMTAGLRIEHRVIKTDELSIEEFVSNTPERCFFCKDELFKKLAAIASSEGYNYLLDGSNTDDKLDYRPGMRAAAKYHVRSPLIETGLSKKEIRELSCRLGLSTWNKPSSPCLASRFPYGQRITKDALKRIEEAEEFLRGLGFQEVRVRDHDMVARIEVNEKEINLLLTPENRRLVSEKLKFLGYSFVSLDLDGYRMGSMNRILEKEHSLEGEYA
jgi:uncharacterized protein